MALIYVGDGSFFDRIPARHLTDAELKALRPALRETRVSRKRLVESGLYREAMDAEVLAARAEEATRAAASAETISTEIQTEPVMESDEGGEA